MQYRIVHRQAGSDNEWSVWNDKAYDLDKAKKVLADLEDNNKFFRFYREYSLQHRSYGEWED